MLKILYGIFLSTSSLAFADLSGLYAGGGLGYGMQGISAYGNSSNAGSPAIKAFAGYQLTDWIGAEAGYTYITQASNWNNLGAPSTTVYDIAATPGFSIPLTPVTIYARLGIDAVSSNLDSAWYNQIFNTVKANFEWGLGLKVNIPATRVFVRAEYINYGSVTNNSNSGMSTTPSVFLINAAYVF
ncbi:MAG: hypothetical protein K0R49_399 [Burkholderiales bacterium]|jgi:hypothetical protein|nr:hypothetical protein [Burkholderiales bacterium]MCE3268147.1 hypothetical protein [Burkholderiales bacterium]